MSEQTAARIPAPSTHQIRHEVGRFAELWRGAMFLKPAAYHYQRDRKSSFAHGLLYVVLIGVIVAIATIIGAGTRYATEPSFEGVKNTVLVHLQAMPFYLNNTPAFHQNFDQTFERIADQLGPVFLGYPVTPTGFGQLLLRIFTTPLGLLLSWVIYGALVHLIGRGWDRTTSYGELLGTTALAFSPQLLQVLNIFPGVGISGGVLFLWAFICNVFAIRVAYHTNARRAVWGAVFPYLVLFVILLLVAGIGAAILIPVARIAGGPR